jgi:hypothetical protein
MWAAFLPSLVRASAPGPAGAVDAVLQASFCSTHAASLPAPGLPGEGTTAPPAGTGFATHAHCPLCSSAGEHAALLPAVAASSQVAVAGEVSLASAALAVPAQRAWPGASPRGPPAPR